MAITNKADWDNAQRISVKKLWALQGQLNGAQFADALIAVQEGSAAITSTGFVPSTVNGIFGTIPAGDWLIESCTIGCCYYSTTGGWASCASQQIMVYEILYDSGYKANPAAAWTQTFTPNPNSVIDMVPEGNVLGLEALVYNKGTAFTATTQTGTQVNFLNASGAGVSISPQIFAHTANQSNQNGVRFLQDTPNGISSIYQLSGGSYAITGTFGMMVVRPLFQVELPYGVSSKKFYWDILGMQRVRNTTPLLVLVNNVNQLGYTYYSAGDSLSLKFNLVKA